VSQYPHVEINGEIYVPVRTLKGSVSIETIGKALLRGFYGEVEASQIEEVFKDVRIVVTDMPRGSEGVSWEEFLEALQEAAE
jgi:hypothetical protein